ncbi:MAG TPA: hypothetical protein DCE33_13265, partial [Rhodospirillaceae bacterium]|nr:hypothetical protein [Rhodospirillaceae bacterium]
MGPRNPVAQSTDQFGWRANPPGRYRLWGRDGDHRRPPGTESPDHRGRPEDPRQGSGMGEGLREIEEARMGELDGKVAVVTGGSRGMGRSALNLFAAAGATVVTCGRTQEDLDKAVSELKDEFGVTAYGIQTDIRDGDSVDAFMAEVEENCGAIHMLGNNAGE